MIPLNLLSDINTIASIDRFADYLMKLVEAKIKLYDVSNDLCDTAKSYDPISFSPLKTFKMLSMMWMFVVLYYHESISKPIFDIYVFWLLL